MICILQAKLDATHREIGYKIQYKKFQCINCSDDEELDDGTAGDGYIDPYYVKIKMSAHDIEEYFNFSSCYDGNYSYQFGNCVLRKSYRNHYYNPQIGDQKEINPASEWNAVIPKSNLEKLFLAMEIARRKVSDKKNKDVYFDLPISCAIVMSKSLKPNETPDHNCFRGEKYKRENAIKKLLSEYCKNNEIETVDELTKKLTKDLDKFFDSH